MTTRERISSSLRGVEAFVREYTAGFDPRDLQRLFDRDAALAYDVLTRDHPLQEEPSGLRGTLRRARGVFLGLSYKLTPPRRLLFAVSMLLALLGVFNPTFEWSRDGVHLSLQFTPVWFLLSVGGLTFLLALELVDRVRFRDELEVARELQLALLPRVTPEIEGFEIAHAYRTANAVGGDYYDVFPLDDGRFAVLVGDASGHGIAAGLLMAIVHATLRTAVDLDPEPGAVLRLANRTLCRTGGSRAFMSLFFAVLDPASGRLVYGVAGHPFPFLRRADGSVRELGEGGLPLGLREGLTAPVGEIELQPGDLLSLYSDGLPEALDASGASYGFDRVRKRVAEGGSAKSVRDRLLADLEGFRRGEPLQDDLSLLILARSS